MRVYNEVKFVWMFNPSQSTFQLLMPSAMVFLPSSSFVVVSRTLCDTVDFQVSIFGSTYTLVTSLAQGVRDALDGMTGETSDVSVDYMRFVNWTDDYEDDTKLFSKHMDFSCRIKNDPSTAAGYPTPDGSNIITALNLTEDYTWSGIVPAGYLIESIIFEESIV